MGRHHANHGIGFVHQLYGLADDRLVAVVVTFPELVAQNDDWLWILSVGSIGWQEVPPLHGGYSQHLKHIAGEIHPLDIFRYVAASYGQVPPVEGHDIFK